MPYSATHFGVKRGDNWLVKSAPPPSHASHRYLRSFNVSKFQTKNERIIIEQRDSGDNSIIKDHTIFFNSNLTNDAVFETFRTELLSVTEFTFNAGSIPDLKMTINGIKNLYTSADKTDIYYNIYFSEGIANRFGYLTDEKYEVNTIVSQVYQIEPSYKPIIRTPRFITIYIEGEFLGTVMKEDNFHYKLTYPVYLDPTEPINDVTIYDDKANKLEIPLCFQMVYLLNFRSNPTRRFLHHIKNNIPYNWSGKHYSLYSIHINDKFYFKGGESLFIFNSTSETSYEAIMPEGWLNHNHYKAIVDQIDIVDSLDPDSGEITFNSSVERHFIYIRAESLQVQNMLSGFINKEQELVFLTQSFDSVIDIGKNYALFYKFMGHSEHLPVNSVKFTEAEWRPIDQLSMIDFSVVSYNSKGQMIRHLDDEEYTIEIMTR